MRKTTLLVAAGWLLVLLGGCQEEMYDSISATAKQAPSARTPTAQSAELPPADAQAFWRYITVTNPYTSWDPWPGRAGIYPGQSPHGAYLKLYANPVAIRTLRAGSAAMPNGAIVVKENYGEDRATLMAITPMYKVSGYNPSAGDWFWAKYGPKGQVMEAGKVDGCISCHKTAPDNDWLFTPVK